MKHFIFFICITLGVLNANAQYDSTVTVIDSTDYQFSEKWHRLYENVPTDSAHTGYFIDKMVWLNNHPARYNGIIDTNGGAFSSADTVYFETITNLHHGLKMAYVGAAPNTILFDSTDLLLQKAITYANDTLLPIAVMRINYNYISDSAFLDSTLYIDLADTSIKPVMGNYNNPFAQATLFAVAPAWGELEQDNYKQILPHDLILNNTGDTAVIGRFKLGNEGDGDGGGEGDTYTELPIGQPVLVDWSNMDGTQIIWIEVLFSNGLWYRSLAPIRFYGKKAPYTGIYANNNDTLKIAANNQHDGAVAEMRYGCGKTKLTKPLIIIEGFDPDSKNDMNRFLEGITDPENTKIYERIQELEAQGYDMVFINFNNSLDSIERNTRIFKEVVQRLNTLKANNGSTEKNVVMGFSMGGLIGRMGLSEMEIQELEHQTEAYISVDAPHRGAHIPKSLQFLVSDLQGILDYGIFGFSLKDFAKPEDLTEFNKAYNTITSYASKQMLIDNIFDVRIER